MIGAFAVTGAFAAALGDTPTELTWAAPDEPVTSCPPLADLPSPDDAEAPPPDDRSSSSAGPPCEALPPLLGEATVTGALAVAGAATAVLGDVPTLPTWAAPDEPVTSWSPPEADVPPAEAEAPDPPDRDALPPLLGEATVIGALAATGAFAAALGATSTAPT